jgi:hypothetical protein
MKIALEFPDTASLTQFDHEYLKKALVATLYHLGQLFEYAACAALGLTRRAFAELLPRFGFSVLADDQATIEVEQHA